MFTRRNLLKSGAAIAASSLALPAIAAGIKIKIGYVSPQSGPLSAFSKAMITWWPSSLKPPKRWAGM